MKNTMVETLIGAAVILIASGFFLFAYQISGKANASGGYRLLACNRRSFKTILS